MASSRKSELWIPPLHPKQELAFNSIATELLYGGATRGGKSHLVRVAYILWCQHVPNLQCDIFRLNYDDVIAENMDGKHSFPDLLAPWERDGLVTLTKTEVRFWNGAVISLEHCGSDRVMTKHQGIGKHVRCFSEATQIGTPRIKWLRAWVTMPIEMKEQLPEQLKDLYPNLAPELLREFFPKILYTSNPIGPSASYFRREFVKARPKFTVSRAPDSDGGFLRQYIPAKVEDNPSEDPVATKRRVSGIGNAATADALLNENWDAPTGDFFRDYDDNRHTTADFTPPDWWFKYRTFDWGSADPFCCLWFCVSDGEEFKDHTGAVRWFPRRAIIIYREWYGCNPDEPAKGLGMRNPDIAKGILSRTLEPQESWITLTDSYPFKDDGHTGPDAKRKFTIADDFFENGVLLTRANTRRSYGSSQVRDRLVGKDGVPMLYVCESCKYTREYLPAIETDPTNHEAYVEDGEATHSVDCVRYGCAAKPIVQDEPKSMEERLAEEKLLTPKKILAQLARKSGGESIGRR